MKEKLLITGATGNVGKALLQHLDPEIFDIYLAVRDIGKAQKVFDKKKYSFYDFDIETGRGIPFTENFDSIFLLRPPQITNIKKYFNPILDEIKRKGIKKLIFLSVQGADKIAIIPHAKIEKEIVSRDISHIFVRPSYFMENLITTMYDEIITNRRIYLPSKNAKYNWISVNDIGKVVSKLFVEFDKFLNTSHDINTPLNLSFKEIVEVINSVAHSNLKYQSPGLFEYLIYMFNKKEHLIIIFVMLLLHYLPQFFPEPPIKSDFFKLFGSEPESFIQFVERNKEMFVKVTAK